MRSGPAVVAVVCLVSALLSRARASQDTVGIPDSARALRNPLSASPELLRGARVLWRKHCETCHGESGKGDGPNARLHEQRKNVAPKDLTEPAFQKEIQDGEIFWRLSNGIIDADDIIMPAYAEKIPSETERWQLVVFVRELGRARNPTQGR